MTSENTNSPDTIKYSIWQTRTEEIDPDIKEKMVGSVESTNQKAKTPDSRD